MASTQSVPTDLADSKRMVNVLCPLCGVSITPNPSNTCASCLASKADVTRGISTEATLHQCRGCQRWHQEAGKWIACELESRELMTLCLKNVSGLNKAKGRGEQIRLVDAAWIWTEPHSMRLKVRLTIQKEVQTGTILQQTVVVEFMVRNQQCVECQAAFRQGSWRSLVQVRQRVSHKRTFLYLEQLILKHGAHRGCLSVETFRDGMDFYFPEKGKAARFISFLDNVVPIKVKSSKKLIGTDDKSNISNFKYTNLIEICTICKDDLLFLPKKAARNLGNISRLVLVKNVSNVIHLIDPISGQTAQMSSDAYWRDPLRPIITAARSRYTRYVVLGKEPVVERENVSKKSITRRNRNKLASLTLAKEDDLGVNDTQFEEKSIVGYLMKSGDVAVGYDLTETQLVGDDAEVARTNGEFPDAIIFRKLYGGVANQDSDAAKQRIFKLQRLGVDITDTLNTKKSRKEKDLDDVDEEDFLREVEADKEMRSNMNVYKSKEGKKTEVEIIDEEDDQKVTLNELLDGLVLSEPDTDTLEMSEEILEEGERAAKDKIAYIGKDKALDIKTKDVAVSAGNVFGKEFMTKDFKFL